VAGSRPAIFLDRDGVVNELVWDQHTGTEESPLAADAVRVVDGAAAAIVALKATGRPVVVVSNQPSAAKGRVTIEVLRSVHDRLLQLLADAGAEVDASYLCLHHPDGSVPELGRACDCRKPAPGLLLQAAADLDIDLSRSWLIGDTDADVGAAQAAGLAGVVVVANPKSSHRRGDVAAGADKSFDSTPDAAAYILSRLA
jgi:D-glycero-D-manno-heptose 1,7-bisphosphate phosphatase